MLLSEMSRHALARPITSGAPPLLHASARKDIALKPTHPILYLSLAVLLVCGGFAYSRRTPPGSATQALHIYIGLDTSGSARAHLGGYTLLSGQISARLHSGKDRLTLFRVDDTTQEFSNHAASGSMEDTLTDIAHNVRALSPRPCTKPAVFWKEAARRASMDSARSVIVLFSDGDNDDMTAASQAEICAAARQIASCASVQAVLICGAEPRNWKTLRAAFAPLGDHRFLLLNPAEMDILPIAEALETARH